MKIKKGEEPRTKGEEGRNSRPLPPAMDGYTGYYEGQFSDADEDRYFSIATPTKFGSFVTS